MKIFYGGALLLPETAASYLWLVLALPLVGALLCGLLGATLDRRLGRHASPAIAVAAMLAATATAVATVVLRLLPLPREARSLHQALWPMFDVAGVQVTFGLTVDALSAVMTLVVTGVGTLIHVYAAAYMKDDPGRARFFCYLNLFVAAMLLLVLGDGFVPLLFGWEGVGLCSYLLIGFWYQRPTAADAALKAFVVNRFGDCGFLLGIALLLWGLGARFDAGGDVVPERGRQVATVASRVAGAPLDPKYWARQARTADVRVGPTLGFRALRDQLTVEVGAPGARGNERAARVRPFAEELRQKTLGGMPVVFLVCVLLFLGAAGKSAQVPLFAWLPDAMAGPTPVSALIHAATMVTAGVYLFARLSFLLVLSPGAMAVIAGAGVATAVVGATAAALQTDLKRLLAYSTVSQLGFMFAALGVGAFDAAIFHVVTHAFFKACLFLSAGTIIGALHAPDVAVSGDASAGAGVDLDAQDLRAMGGLSRALPWTRGAFLIAAIGLGGLPLGAGFFSKDRILAAVLAAAGAGSVAAGVAFVVLAAVVALTAFYVFRGYYLVFRSGSPRTAGAGAAHEPALASPLIFVLVLLAVATIVVGPWLGWPHAWSAAHGPSSFERFLAPVFAASTYLDAPAELGVGAEWALEIGGVALALGGLLLARRLYRASSARLPREGARGRVAMFLGSGWRFDELYRGLVLVPAHNLARAAVWLDRRIFDALINGLGALGMLLGRLAGAMDRGVVDGAVNGVSTLVLAAGRRTARLQTGRIGTYVAGIAGGIAVLVVLAYLLGS